MGRRTVLPKFQVITDADTETDPESEVSDVSSVDYITYQLELDSSVNALFEVQFCNDARIDGQSQFKTLNFNQATTLDGLSEADGLIHIENHGFKFMKLKIINNTGTGFMNAWITGTVRGA